MSYLDIYTDGAYSPARNQGGVGIIFVKDNKVLKAYGKMFKNVTNNKMELAAVIIALKTVLKNNIVGKISIITDSQYVIGCASKGWKRKKNVKLWEIYDKAELLLKSKGVEIEFKWVHGHAANKFNNLADKMAVSASQEIEL